MTIHSDRRRGHRRGAIFIDLSKAFDTINRGKALDIIDGRCSSDEQRLIADLIR